MIQFLYHYVYVDLWKNMWGNIFAPSIFALLAILVSHVKSANHRRELEKQIKLGRHYNKNDPYTLDSLDH